jgi:hypothetical protein
MLIDWGGQGNAWTVVIYLVADEISAESIQSPEDDLLDVDFGGRLSIDGPDA